METIKPDAAVKCDCSWSKRIDEADISLFTAPSQTSDGDRASLLQVQRLIRSAKQNYRYAEVGSHLGGSLVPHLVDPLCSAIYSIDPRPLSQLDERGRSFDYEGNSTERMLQILRPLVPADSFKKLITFDLDARNIPTSAFTPGLDLVLIDGEHTNIACFSDAISLLPALAHDALITFHDSNLIFDAIMNCERIFTHLGLSFSTALMPDCVAVIGIGCFAGLVSKTLTSFDRQTFMDEAHKNVWAHIVQEAVIRGEVLRP